MPSPEIRHQTSHLYPIRFPKETSYNFGQNEAFFFLSESGKEKQLKFHDYSEIYKRSGLYEQLFYERLQCRSPAVVVSRLEKALENAGESLSDRRMLDFGAGNGIVAERLRETGCARIVGLDIIPEARDAALRDRPGAYDDYLVGDITALSAEQQETLLNWNLSGLVCVAALGFDDIPAAAFIRATDQIAEDGWLAFNIKSDFLESGTQFAEFVKALLTENLIELHLIERYWHRLSIDGDWLEYFVMVAKKRGHLGDSVKMRFAQPD